VVDEGVTGFVVSSEDEAVAAVNKVGSLSRKKVRERFEQRFTAERMAGQYVSIYNQMIARKKPALHLVEEPLGLEPMPVPLQSSVGG
jgi:hypothetical protein